MLLRVLREPLLLTFRTRRTAQTISSQSQDLNKKGVSKLISNIKRRFFGDIGVETAWSSKNSNY